MSTKNAKDWSLSVNPFQSVGQGDPGIRGNRCPKNRYFSEESGCRRGIQRLRPPIVSGGSLGALVWPNRCDGKDSAPNTGAGLDQRKAGIERREWARLPLAIPVFVRSRDNDGKDFLEFARKLWLRVPM